MSYQRLVRALSRQAARRPLPMLFLCLAVSVPAVFQVRKIRLDTQLQRLLPRDSRAVRTAQELEGVVGGDGGYFSIIFEGRPGPALLRAHRAMAERARALPEVRAVEDRTPVEFIRRYRYLLVPSHTLREALELVDEMEREANPLIVDLEEDEPAGAPRTDTRRLQERIERYLDMPAYPRSPDGRLVGLIVRPWKAVTSLGEARALYGRLAVLAEEVARAEGVRAWVSGANRNKVDNYLQIREDLARSGTVAGLGVLAVLLAAYRSVRILPVVLFPLGLGLLWSYALVPALVGDLNTVTSFLLMVLFGTGVEFAVHLVMRFQGELGERGVEHALEQTYRSTGRSIVTSGLATTLGMAVLILSRFRGFAEFGIISAAALLAIFGAMFVALPPALALGTRVGLVRPRAERVSRWWGLPRPWATAALTAMALGAGALAVRALRFDYDFTRLQPEVPAANEARERHRGVFPGFTVPGAFYAARDLPAVDGVLAAVQRRRDELGPQGVLGAASSIRDFAPGPSEFEERLGLVREIRERLRGAWTRRIEDEQRRRLVEDIRDFEPPPQAPGVAEVPPEIRSRFEARDGSGEWIVAVEVVGAARDGRVAMAFTREVYGLPMPPGVRGPTGDKPVLAEILWLVTEEAPWIVGLTLLGVFLLVLLDRRSLPQALVVMVPLAAGLSLTLGLMALVDWRLNFFNMVVLPNLIGNTVDNGVHYYRRWRELGRDAAAAHAELAPALTASALTTMMGYGGLLLAHHAGLRSIGSMAVLGLTCCWMTGVGLMPGLLAWLQRRREETTRGRAAA